MRSYWIRATLIRGERFEDTEDTQRGSEGVGGRDWSYGAMSWEMPRIAHNHQKLRECHGMVSPLELPERTNPADTLILYLWPPNV